MKKHKRDTIILGAGPAGLMLAYRLLQMENRQFNVTVIEKQSFPGGISGSFQEHGIWLDFGSHRLHPATPGTILDEIKSLLGSSLLQRQRNGRIRLLGRYLKFPLKPLDSLVHLPLFSFTLPVVRDLLMKPLSRSNPAGTFAEILRRGLGPTICTHFYFPYARKLWGIPPDQIDVVQAHKRISAGSIGKILKKMAGFLPGFQQGTAGIFHYPEQGIGQISRRLAERIVELGGTVRYQAEAEQLLMDNNRICGVVLRNRHGEQEHVRAELILSTIPLTRAVRMLDGLMNSRLQRALESLTSRSMIFCYLVMDCDQWLPYDAHYFPEEEYIFSRISEPKNYSGAVTPAGRTILCCEIPCTQGGKHWQLDDEQLKDMVIRDMRKAGIPPRELVDFFSRRLPDVYPVYRTGYGEQLNLVEQFLARIGGFATLGRQGLFTHDNIHHSMMMAERAAHCVDSTGNLDPKQWEGYAEEFAGYVVED